MDTLNIEINQVQPSAFFVVITLISAILSFVVFHYRMKKLAKLSMKSEYFLNNEEDKEELRENIISEIKNIRKTNTKQEELNAFAELVPYIQHSRTKFLKPEDYEPIFEEIDDLESVSDELEESIQQSFTEARDSVRDKAMEKASIDEKQQRLEERYEDMAFDDNK